MMIKSNPKPAGWVTHNLENNNTKEVLHLTSGFPDQGSYTETGNPQGIWGFPCRSEGFDYRTSTRLEEIEIPVLVGTNKILCTPGPRGKEQSPHGRLNQNYLLVLEGLWWRCDWLGFTTKTGALAAAVLEGPPWCKPSWSSQLTLPYSPQTPGLGCLRLNSSIPSISR